MLLRILNIAIFILLVWLILQFSLLQKQVSVLQTISQQHQQQLGKDFNTTQKNSSEKLNELSKKVQKIADVQGKSTTATKKLKSLQSKQSKLNTLHKAYILVLEAEAARGAKDTKTAQQRLTASKKLIWKSGSNYPAQKKSLHGLMKAIDTTLGAWKRKDFSKSTKPIYSVVAKVIKQQDK